MPLWSLNSREARPDRVTADAREPGHVNRNVVGILLELWVGVPSELATATSLRETKKAKCPTTRQVSLRSLSSALRKEGHEDGM